MRVRGAPATAFCLVVAAATVCGHADPAGARNTHSRTKPKPAPTITLRGPVERTLEFDDRTSAGAPLATLNVIVDVTDPARDAIDAQLVFLAPRPPSSISTRLQRRQPAGVPKRPVLYAVNPGSLKLGRGPARRAIGFRVAIPPASRPEATTGTLLITLRRHPRVQPVAIAVAGQGPQVKFSPSPVKLKVTKELAGLSADAIDGAGADLLVSGPGAQALVASRNSKAPFEATLLADPNHSMSASLLPPLNLTHDGLAKARLVLPKIAGPGKYTGEIVLDPASSKPTTLPIEVTVRDGVFWPLLAVTLGATIGGLGVALQDRRRRRDIVRIALKRAVDRYQAQRRSDGREEDPLSDDMYRPDALGYGVLFPKPGACKQRSDSWGRVANLYCDAHTAKEPEVLDMLSADAQQVVAGFERWHMLRREVRGLRLALRRANPPARSAVRTQTEALAGQIAVEPDADAAVALADRFTRQRRVLGAYAVLEHLFGMLSPSVRRTVSHFAPEAVYSAAPPEEDRDAAASYRLLLELAAAQRVMLKPESAPDDIAGLELADVDVSQLIAGARTSFLTAPRLTLDGALSRTFAQRPPIAADRRSAASIKRGLQRWDLSLFLITAAATVLVYTLGLWTDTWGSFADYATAFAAGVLGQVAVGQAALNWNLFPALRSYRLSTPQSDPPPAPATPAV